MAPETPSHREPVRVAVADDMPAVAPAKCVPITRTGLSHNSPSMRSRVRRASSGSLSAADDQSGRAIWQGWCMKSPVISASSPFELIRTLTCPGVCPKVGTRLTSSQIRWSVSTRSASPASWIGATESANTAAMSSRPRCARQCVEFDAAHQIAGVREGRDSHLGRPTSIVFHPT